MDEYAYRRKYNKTNKQTKTGKEVEHLEKKSKNAPNAFASESLSTMIKEQP